MKVLVEVTIQQVCAFTALTVRIRETASENPITEGDFNGFSQSNLCFCNSEGTEQLLVELHFLSERGSHRLKASPSSNVT